MLKIKKKNIFPVKCLGVLPLDYIGQLPGKESFSSVYEYNEYISYYSKKYNRSASLTDWSLKKNWFLIVKMMLFPYTKVLINFQK